MSIGFSMFLIAVGAILAWAVNMSVAGIDIKIVGAILMVVGLAGMALSLLFWTSFTCGNRREINSLLPSVEALSTTITSEKQFWQRWH